MTIFQLTGKPTRCSREYVRAWLHASACVLAFHNKHLPPIVHVDFTDDLRDQVVGTWSASQSRICLKTDLRPEAMATTVLHEVIHGACGDFGDHTDEKCCSTLTARLKPHVNSLAQPLVDGVYKRAAYIAHTKLAYVTDDDYYDQDQHHRVGAKDPHGPRRRRRKSVSRVDFLDELFEEPENRKAST